MSTGGNVKSLLSTPELGKENLIAASSQPKNKVKQQTKAQYKPKKMFTFSDGDIRRSYTKQLDKVFAKHCPSKRNQVPRMIARYPGREGELLRKTKAMFEKRSAEQRKGSKGGLMARMGHCISSTFVMRP